MSDSVLNTSLSLPSLAATPRSVPVPQPGQWSAAWCSSHDWAPWLPLWQTSLARYAPDDLGASPEWCTATEAMYPGVVRLLLVHDDQRPALALPLLLRRQSLDCHLGEVRVARFHPRVLQWAGLEPGLPQDAAIYHTVFQALLAPASGPAFHALRFSLPAQSPLWSYFASPEFAHFGLRRYDPAPQVPHHLLRLPPTFGDYLAKFTPKTRKNRFRELKYLEQRGPVTLVEVRHPEQVEGFLTAAHAISLRSYQHRLLKAGLRTPDHLRQRLHIAAENGWLRSYLLRCGDTDCSFMLGYQYRGRYHYTKVGYDPAWAKLCVGTILQLLVLQDLYRRDTPATVDFGVQGPQKKYFGNDFYWEREVYFFRPGVYAWLATTSHRASRRLTTRASAWLDRHHLKPRAQRLIRRLRGC